MCFTVSVCPTCASALVASEEKCSTCGEHIGYPNVRAANQPEERAALGVRYAAAVSRAQARGAGAVLQQFEEAVARSSAVVSCDLYRLREILADPRVLYTNYHLAVRGQVRQAAIEEFDRYRRTVDASLFGGYAEHIRNAALSLDGEGLPSYGGYSMVLRDVAVAKRASVLEENAYNFVKHHALQPGDPIPPGYRATWGSRQQLAVAKLADLIDSKNREAEFQHILMAGGADRSQELFIEVHIYDGFNQNAIEAVRGTSSPKRPDEKAVVTVVKELLSNLNKTWIEK